MLELRKMSHALAIPVGIPKHVAQLDSLRGIAALMVTGHHSLVLTNLTTYKKWLLMPFQILIDGRIAVVIFFVLSGYVLGMSLRRTGDTTVSSYFTFYLRRIFRLWPAYAVSTAFYLFLYIWLRNSYLSGNLLSAGWFDFLACQNLTTSNIIQNFCFEDVRLNGATWTLRVEMQVALVLPLLHWLTRRVTFRGAMPILLGLILLGSVQAQKPIALSIFVFYAGYVLGLIHEHPAGHFMSVVRNWRNTFFGAALAIFMGSHFFARQGIMQFFGYTSAMIGAVFIISVLLAAPESRFFRPLEYRAVRFLGKISYSYYLYSLLSIDLIGRLLVFFFGSSFSATLHGSLVIFTLAIGIAIVLAIPSYFFVERPFIRLSGIVSRKLQVFRC